MEHIYFPTTMHCLFTAIACPLVASDSAAGFCSPTNRVESAELRLTQEFIVNMLGGRRESVTKAARHLQAAGLISYVRGHITILDRQGLEAASCECCQVVKAEFDRLLGKE
jgi:CRP-like cAMP-binding protein